MNDVIHIIAKQSLLFLISILSGLGLFALNFLIRLILFYDNVTVARYFVFYFA